MKPAAAAAREWLASWGCDPRVNPSRCADLTALLEARDAEAREGGAATYAESMDAERAGWNHQIAEARRAALEQAAEIAVRHGAPADVEHAIRALAAPPEEK